VLFLFCNIIYILLFPLSTLHFSFYFVLVLKVVLVLFNKKYSSLRFGFYYVYEKITLVITFLGCPRTAIEGKIVVGRLWPVDVLDLFICGLRPNQLLQLVGFKFAHFHKQKRITVQDHLVSVEQLAVDIGKGCLLIIPDKDLPQPLVE
jgi:hypothetical protein